MRSRFIRKLLPLAVLGALTVSIPQPLRAQAKYQIIELTLPETKTSWVIDINNAGDVLADADNIPFLYHDGKIKMLSALVRAKFMPLAMNSKGDIVGYGSSAGNQQAFLYHNGALRIIGKKKGADSAALGINAKGEVVGREENAKAQFRATQFAGPGVTYLDTLGGQTSFAYAINIKGEIVGETATKRDNNTHAFLYKNGAMRDLGVLGGFTSKAVSINDSGDVVGEYMSNAFIHAFLYHQGKMKDLGAPQGGGSEARDINNHGAIVGSAYPTAKHSFAMLYSEGKIIDLNSLLPADSGWELEDAYKINDKGWIIGSGSFHGEMRGFLLLPPAAPSKPSPLHQK